MARRKKIDDDAAETLTAGAGDAAGTLTEPPGDDEGDEREEADETEEDEQASPLVEPTEVEGIEKLPQERQDELLRGMEQEGKDVSILRARINSARRRQWQHTALLSRLDPVRAADGTKIRGIIERFEAPFSDLEIKDFARRFCGGGTYEIAYYDSNHQVGFRERFDAPGRPKSREETELALQNQPRVAAAANDDKTQELLRSFTTRASGEADGLREQLRLQQVQQLLAEQDRKHAEQMAEMRRLVEVATQASAKKPSTLEILATLGPALAPFVPVLKAFVDRGGHNELADVMKMVRDGQADQAKQMREALDAARTKGSSGGPLEAATTKLVDLAIARTLGDGARHRDPQDLVFKMLEQMLPNIMDRAMDIAAMKGPGGGDEDDGKMSPKWALEKFGELMKPVLEQAMGKRAAAGGPASAGMPGMALGMPNPMVPYGYPGMPMMPMVQPTAGVYPYTTAQPVQSMPGQPIQGMPGMVMPGMVMPGQQVLPVQAWPASAGQPGQPGQPMMRVPVATAMPGIVHPGMVVPQPPVVMPGQPGQPQMAVPTGPPPPPPDIDPRLFALMHQALMAGKSGDEIAKVVDDELEAIEKGTSKATPLLSERAIEILETTPPDVVVQHFFEAAPPDILRLFCDPTGQIAPYALAFTKEFCAFFFDDDEDDADETPAATAPAAPATA